MKFVTVKQQPKVYTGKTTFIVAIKGRTNNIAGFAGNITRYYPEANIIFVIQADNNDFNKGALYNLGYKHSNTEVVVFHDIDIRHTTTLNFLELLENFKKPFVCFDEIADYKENICISSGFRPTAWGGCVVFTREQYEACGGFSNRITGWGYDDAIINKRANLQRLKHRLNHIFHKRLNEQSKGNGNFEANKKVFDNDNPQIDNFNSAEGTLLSTHIEANIFWYEYENLKNGIVKEYKSNINILIPAYKAQDFIEECLDSINSQTFKPVNIIVGVDGCIETLSKIKSILYKYKNLTVYYSENNVGTYVMFNSLISIVPDNEFIITFGADDIMNKDMVARLFENNKPKISQYEGVMFINKSDLINVGGFRDWRCAADADILRRLVLAGVTYTKYPLLFHYREHDNQLTKKSDTNKQSDLRMQYKQIINTSTDIYIKPVTTPLQEIKNIIENIYVTVIMNCYNDEKENFIKAVESVLANKNVKIQLIVSTVKGDKCIVWSKKYPIELVVNEKAGIYEQINATIPFIKGDFVTYSSSNDFMYDYKLYNEVKCLIDNNKKVCYSAFDVNKEGAVKTNKFYNYDYEKHLSGNFVSDCAMVEKRLFMLFMPFKLKYGNQAYYDLWLRIYEAEGNVFHYYDRPTWQYIIRDASQHVQRKTNPEKIRINTDLKKLLLKDRKFTDYYGRITQLKCSQSVIFFKDMMKSKYGLNDYTDPYKPTLFFGMYTSSDYRDLENHKGQATVLWCGTDGKKINTHLHLIENSFKNARHIVMSNFLKNDLSEHNIKCEKISITPSSSCINPELRGDCIYIYGGKQENNFYCINHVPEIERRTGLKVITAYTNSFTREELMDVYKSCFIGLRLTEHDGLPNTVIELGLMGRRCLYNGGTPNSIKWTGIDDICESIMNEYKNRNIDDVQQVHDAVFDFVNVGTKWLYEKPLKIYVLLSALPYLDNSSGDRINEINIYKCLNSFADVYYNNQKLDFNDKINYGTNPNAIIEKPKKYDLYYIRNNKDVFNKIKGKKIYFSVPNHQEAFNQADALVYITKTWSDFMLHSDRDNLLMNIYKNTDYIPEKHIIFNQTTYPQDLRNNEKTIGFKSKYAGFIIGHFGRVAASNYPHKFLSIIDKLKGCTVLFNKTNSKLSHDKITFIDRVEYNDMPYVLSACDCLLYNQDAQGRFAGSLKIIEALSYGIPILSPRYEARYEELGCDYELYYDTENELYEKIMWLKNNPTERERIGNKLLMRAERYNYKNNSLFFEKQILKLWEQN